MLFEHDFLSYTLKFLPLSMSGVGKNRFMEQERTSSDHGSGVVAEKNRLVREVGNPRDMERQFIVCT